MYRVCEADGMPNKATVFRWLRTHQEFRDQYEAAKDEAADFMVEEIKDIADDGRNDYMDALGEGAGVAYRYNGEHVQRSRLRVDARKWTASKLKPKKYGDKVSQEISGPEGKPVQVEWSIQPVIPIDQANEENPEG